MLEYPTENFVLDLCQALFNGGNNLEQYTRKQNGSNENKQTPYHYVPAPYGIYACAGAI